MFASTQKNNSHQATGTTAHKSGMPMPHSPASNRNNAQIRDILNISQVSDVPDIQRIEKNPTNIPFDGEINVWSAALRSEPEKSASAPHQNTIADLPKGHPVRVLGGEAWVFVKTRINGEDRSGYVSHELIDRVATVFHSFETDAGDPISTSGGNPVPTLDYEENWMAAQGLDSKVTRVNNSATNKYNCHGFIYLNAGGWLNDPSPIIRDNGYTVPDTPMVGDAVMYTQTAPTLDVDRRPVFAEVPPHSGVVSEASGGNASEVTSKWGSWHLYKHKPEDVWSGYGIPTFLRSVRVGGNTAITI